MNKLLEFNTWRIRYDPEVNRHIYQRITTAAPQDCGCNGCLGFLEMRETFYPEVFKQLLSELGIDYRKEAEVVTYVEPKTAPLSGWYNFVGEIEKGEDEFQCLEPTFQIQMSAERRLVKPEFGTLPIVMLEWQWLPQDFVDSRNRREAELASSPIKRWLTEVCRLLQVNPKP